MIVIKFKRHITSINIFYIIISKLSHLKESYLVILLKINKNLEISFYYTILFFSLAIYLKLKDDIKFSLNIKKIT